MNGFRQIAAQAARAGGTVVRAHDGRQAFVEKKLNFDYVTDVDMLSEKAIRAYLGEQCPGFRFMGEETVYQTHASEEAFLEDLAEDDWTWIVDPLDGTTNFIRRIPQYCVSVALAHGKELVAGAIYDCTQDAVFSAEKGQGAFLNGEPIHVSPVEDPREAILGAAFPAAEISLRAPVMEALNRLSAGIGSIRVYNCAALMMCYVACGRLDASFERGIHIWDIGAGAVIVREAGGEVTNTDGTPFSVFSREQFSGSPAMLRAIGPYLRA